MNAIAREDARREVELRDLSSEFFHDTKRVYSFRFNGKIQHTGCKQCAVMLDDSTDWDEGGWYKPATACGSADLG